MLVSVFSVHKNLPFVPFIIYWVTDIFKYKLCIYYISDTRYKSIIIGGDIMYGRMHGHGCCCCTPWDSLSKKEKLEILGEKKKWLEMRAKDVGEAIKEIEKGK
jgi:hypothetical protein